MKFLITLFFILLTSALSFSQKITVKISEEFGTTKIIKIMDPPKLKPITMSEFKIKSQFFNTGANRTYTLFGFMESKMRFMVSDDFINPVDRKDFSAEVVENGKTQAVGIVSLVNSNGKLYMLYTIDNPAEDKFSLYVNEVSKDLVVLGSPILVQSYSDLKKSKGISFEKSENEKYFLVRRIFSTGTDSKYKLDLKVLDTSFGEVWRKTTDVDLVGQGIKSSFVDNDGNVYLLTEKPGDNGSVYTVHACDSKTQNYRTAKIGSGENSFGLEATLLNGQKFHAVGLLEKDKSVSCFVDRFDLASGTVQRLNTRPMGDDFMKAANTGHYKTKFWKIANLVSTANNDLVASFEAPLQQYGDGASQFFNQNAYVLSFNSDGALNYQHTVYKEQASYDASLIGHALIPIGNKVWVVYNDQPDNIKLSPQEKKVQTYPGVKRVMIVVQEIDEKGKVTKRQLTTDPKVEDFSLHLAGLSKVKSNLYYAPLINRPNNFNFKTKFMTIGIE